MLPREYRVDGLVEAVHRATVSAQIMGQVESIHYDVDDRVQQGDLLLKIRDSEYRSRVAQAEAELQAAAAALEQIQDDFNRTSGLFRKDLASASAMDQAEAGLRSAQARYDAAVGALGEAQEQLRYTEIRAPHSGLVTERHIDVGEMANPGQPLMSGLSLDHLRIIIDVPQSFIATLRRNPRVHVHLPEGEDIVVEEITIYPIADADSSSFRVRVDLPEGTQHLFPGMFVKTSLILGQKEELLIPQGAVVHRSEVTGVYVVGEDGRVSFRHVRIGQRLGEDVAVLSGLDEGELTAVEPMAALLALKRGVPVALTEQAAATNRIAGTISHSTTQPH
jgi:RND family efflux transporter MFP subunit